MHAMMVGMVALSLSTAGSPAARALVRFDAGDVNVSLDATGRVTSLRGRTSGMEYLPAGETTPVLTLLVAKNTLSPTSARWDAADSLLHLAFGSGVTATVRIRPRRTHLTLRLVGVEGAKPDRIDWGPFPTTISKTIGETVGVVRDARFALGIQSLNIQTVGGAAATKGGSKLFAHAIEHEGGCLDSAIAIFGCPAAEALPTIGNIEVIEGLPHPMIDGVWAKMTPEATRPYLIASFGEQNIDDVIALAKKLGFHYIYHPGPFKTWGHFRLNPSQFPDGDASMKRCVEKAEAAGIHVGVHTLTAFITPKDPYVTPVPDPRLARLGSSRLTAAIDATATEIPVADREPFIKKQVWGWSRRFVILGEEIVEYKGVTAVPPWKLTGCTRGVFGTTASAHAAGADIGRLATHNYGTFYPGLEGGMLDEMTSRIVQLFNSTGLRQISFDGLEGLSDYGYGGDYTRNRFVKQCWDGWKRKDTINDASNLLHFLWHIHTRMNWGEPWGKAMREGMPERRFRNQAYFDRNLFPHMLGWFQFRTASAKLEATSLDDIEWMLSKAAGYHAGYAIVAQPETFRTNGEGQAAIAAVRAWEDAWRSGAFSPEQREKLKKPDSEWHLEAVGAHRWRLWPVAFTKTLEYPAKGESGKAGWEVTNPFGAQPLRAVVRAVPDGAGVDNPRLVVDGRAVTFAAHLAPGQYLVVGSGWGPGGDTSLAETAEGGKGGSGKAAVCDANWNQVGVAAADGALPVVPPGKQQVEFSCLAPQGKTANTGDPQAEIRLKMVGRPEEARSASAEAGL